PLPETEQTALRYPYLPTRCFGLVVRHGVVVILAIGVRQERFGVDARERPATTVSVRLDVTRPEQLDDLDLAERIEHRVGESERRGAALDHRRLGLEARHDEHRIAFEAVTVAFRQKFVVEVDEAAFRRWLLLLHGRLDPDDGAAVA